MRPENSKPTPFELHTSTLRGLGSDLRNRESPITLKIVLAISLVFLAQEVAAVLLGTSILGVTSYFFLEYPVPAWLLSFFLHKGVKHFFANIALIGFVGRVVEPEFSRRLYLLFIVGSAVLSEAGAFLLKAPFTSKPVAAYGASGFGFALATYSLSFPYRDREGPLVALKPRFLLSNTTPAERIAFLLGVSALLTVVLDLASGPYFTTEWVNGAHLVGVLLGLIIVSQYSVSRGDLLH